MLGLRVITFKVAQYLCDLSTSLSQTDRRLKRSAQAQYNYNTTAIEEFFSCIAVVLHLCGPDMEPGLPVTGHRVTWSAILAGSGRVTGQCVRVSDPVLDPILSFNMRVYRGVVSTE